MIVERIDHDHYTEIHIFTDEDRHPSKRYTVTCAAEYEVDPDYGATEPTARITTPPPTITTIEIALECARHLAFVAGVAAVLQAEKRAAYVARFGQ